MSGPHLQKQRIREQLAAGDVAAVVAGAALNRRVLSFLTALTYDTDPVLADRALDALGRGAGAVSDEDPEFVRGHLRRLFWLLNDESGGIGWRAAEAIGEIIRNRPQRFAEFIPPLIWLLDMEAEDAPRFRGSILRGIIRVAEVAPAECAEAGPLVRRCLADQDAEVRSLAQRCLAMLPVGAG